MTGRTITIREEGTPAPPPAPAKPEARFDVQDGLLAGGILSGELAASVIWWPAALILASLLCFWFAYLIERSKTTGEKKKRGPVSA